MLIAAMGERLRPDERAIFTHNTGRDCEPSQRVQEAAYPRELHGPHPDRPGRSERAADIVAEFVQQKVDVIVSRGAVSVLAAKQATPIIPIVFAGETRSARALS